MIARALAGFLLGAAVAAAAAFLLLRKAGAAPVPGTRAAGDFADAAGRGDETGALQQEIAALEARVRSQKAEADRLAAAAGTPATRRASALRAALAKRLGANARSIADGTFLDSDDWRRLQIDFQRWLATLCDETGLTLSEATWGPDGLYAFLAEVFAAFDPPLPDQVLKDFDASRERIRKQWDEYMGQRSGMSLLRRGVETAEFVHLFYDALLESVPDDRVDEVCAFEQFELSWGDTWETYETGTRPEVRAKLIDQWSEQFALRAEQKTALGPIVDEFMTRFEGLESRRPTGPGQGYEAGLESRRAVISLQEEMQRRIAAELDLNADQAERLRLWSATSAFEVQK